MHDANTVRRIAAAAALGPSDIVLEVGPGLGSLTLGLLPAAGHVYAVEVDPTLAAALPETVKRKAPGHADKLTVLHRDALDLRADEVPGATALVANLPYNVAVPVVLHLLATVPTLRHGLVMVQKEVADRLTASPGSKVYGGPTVKLAWFAQARPAGRVPPRVFWPVPWIRAWSRSRPGSRPRTSTGRRSSRSSTRRSRSGARRCGRRSPAGRAARTRPRGSSPPPGSTRAPAGKR